MNTGRTHRTEESAIGGPFINKLVFLVSATFNQRDEKRFGIELLQRNAFEVEVWDFTPFLRPAKFAKYLPPDPTGFQHYRTFATKSDAISALSELSPRCLVFCMVHYGYESYAIYRTISKRKLPYCVLGYSVPAWDVPKDGSTISRFKNITLDKLLSYSFRLIPFKWLGVKPATMMLALGGTFPLAQFTVGSRTEFIRSHYFDYDVYLEQTQKRIETDKSMGVFLDNYLPFHPDALDENDPIIPPEEYYPLLRRFLDHIERNYGVRIVIAAHPRSNYEKHQGCFGERPVIRGKTAELVMQAGFVILHSSASIAFAVLFRKPLIFVTTDRLRQGRTGIAIGSLIDFLAATFSKKPINLNSTFEIDWATELMIDSGAYKRYITQYIKEEGSGDTPVWQVFANHLKNGHSVGE